MNPSIAVLATFAATALTASPATHAQQSPSPLSMTFFVTSTGSGKGADFGGLAGADKHCQSLAQAAGAGKHAWHAYLSTQSSDGKPAVNARDRIGKGPWHNINGVLIAKNVEDLHRHANINRLTALTEKGGKVNGSGDTPNMHDILTGSQPDGTAFAAGQDRTCGNWTKGGTEGAAMLGHVDRIGLTDNDAARSWNSSHPSRGGCSVDALKSSGGAGLLYCFAAK